MSEVAILRELVVVFAAALVVVLVLGRLRLPTIAGFLVAGALLGPSGLGWVEDRHQIEQLAEIGVVLLLFTIGLEFSIADLRRMGRLLVVGGGLQVLLTVTVVAAWAMGQGYGPEKALFMGFLIALSSTAIVLQGLAERGETDAPHGKLIVGVLLFQDLCVVPMMLITPMLAGQGGGPTALPRALLTAAMVVALTVVLARRAVPAAIRVVARTRRRDLFILAVVVVCAGIAWLTSLVGLSLALGAFLAGVVLADSEEGHQALSDMLPLRDIFTSLFFVSMGMLLDLRVLVEQPLQVIALLVVILMGKALLACLAGLAMRLPLRVALLAGLGLSQVGEFSFVLANLGRSMGLLDENELGVFIAASVLTMLITPFALRFGPALAEGAARSTRVDRFLGLHDEAPPAATDSLHDHVVVLGYGVGGEMLGEVLRGAGLPYAVVDIDADRVRRARLKGEPLFYGDVTSAKILTRVKVESARDIAVMLNDPMATLRAVRTVRRLSPSARILVRARYVGDVPGLLAAGASEVVAQEFEASMEITERVMRGPAIGRGLWTPRPSVTEAPDGVSLQTMAVPADAWIAGRTLSESALRSRTGATLLSISRNDETAVNPSPGDVLQGGDVVCLVGRRDEIAAARQLLARGPAA